MQTWAKRGVHTALVTGGLLMLGTGIASADEDVNPDRPASPLDAAVTVPFDVDTLTIPAGTEPASPPDEVTVELPSDQIAPALVTVFQAAPTANGLTWSVHDRVRDEVNQHAPLGMTGVPAQRPAESERGVGLDYDRPVPIAAPAPAARMDDPTTMWTEQSSHWTHAPAMAAPAARPGIPSGEIMSAAEGGAYAASQDNGDHGVLKGVLDNVPVVGGAAPASVTALPDQALSDGPLASNTSLATTVLEGAGPLAEAPGQGVNMPVDSAGAIPALSATGLSGHDSLADIIDGTADGDTLTPASLTGLAEDTLSGRTVPFARADRPGDFDHVSGKLFDLPQGAVLDSAATGALGALDTNRARAGYPTGVPAIPGLPLFDVPTQLLTDAVSRVRYIAPVATPDEDVPRLQLPPVGTLEATEAPVLPTWLPALSRDTARKATPDLLGGLLRSLSGGALGNGAIPLGGLPLHGLGTQGQPRADKPTPTVFGTGGQVLGTLSGAAQTGLPSQRRGSARMDVPAPVVPAESAAVLNQATRGEATNPHIATATRTTGDALRQGTAPAMPTLDDPLRGQLAEAVATTRQSLRTGVGPLFPNDGEHMIGSVLGGSADDGRLAEAVGTVRNAVGAGTAPASAVLPTDNEYLMASVLNGRVDEALDTTGQSVREGVAPTHALVPADERNLVGNLLSGKPGNGQLGDAVRTTKTTVDRGVAPAAPMVPTVDEVLEGDPAQGQVADAIVTTRKLAGSGTDPVSAVVPTGGEVLDGRPARGGVAEAVDTARYTVDEGTAPLAAIIPTVGELTTGTPVKGPLADVVRTTRQVLNQDTGPLSGVLPSGDDLFDGPAVRTVDSARRTTAIAARPVADAAPRGGDLLGGKLTDGAATSVVSTGRGAVADNTRPLAQADPAGIDPAALLGQALGGNGTDGMFADVVDATPAGAVLARPGHIVRDTHPTDAIDTGSELVGETHLTGVVPMAADLAQSTPAGVPVNTTLNMVDRVIVHGPAAGVLGPRRPLGVRGRADVPQRGNITEGASVLGGKTNLSGVFNKRDVSLDDTAVLPVLGGPARSDVPPAGAFSGNLFDPASLDMVPVQTPALSGLDSAAALPDTAGLPSLTDTRTRLAGLFGQIG